MIGTALTSLRRAARAPEAVLWGASGLVVIVLGWELGARTGILPLRYISEPSLVLATGARMLLSGELLHDVQVTASEFSVGLALAAALGVPLGIAAGWYRRFDYVVNPYLAALYATPSLALLPLLVLWFGIGMRSTGALVFLSAVFPIVINVLYGVRTVEASHLRMARSFNAPQVKIFRAIVLPGTVPFIMSGLRLGIARGLIGVVVGEMYAARDGGLGYAIAIAGATLAVDRLFVAVVVITGAGVVLIGLVGAGERRLQHWKPRASA